MSRVWVWAQRIGLILSGLLLGWLVGTQTKPLRIDFGDLGALKSSTLGVGAVGLAVGVLVATVGRPIWQTFWASRTRPSPATLSNSMLAGFTFVAFLMIVALVDAGVQQNLVEPARGALGLALALLTLLFGVVALSVLQRGEPVELESHWGGIGGALGGWRLSSPAVLIMLVVVFVFGAALVLAPDSQRAEKPGASAPAATAKAS